MIGKCWLKVGGFARKSSTINWFLNSSRSRFKIKAVAAPVAPAPENSAEYRRELCEKYGFRKIAEPLPDNVTLRDIIDTLPKEVISTGVIYRCYRMSLNVFDIDDVNVF